MSKEKQELNSMLARLEEAALTELDTPDFASSQLTFVSKFGETLIDIDQFFRYRQESDASKDGITKVMTAIYLHDPSLTPISHISIMEKQVQNDDQINPMIFLDELDGGLSLLARGDLLSSLSSDLYPIVVAANSIYRIAKKHEVDLYHDPKGSSLIVPEDTEAYQIAYPIAVDLLTNTKKLLAEHGRHLYQKTKHLKVPNTTSYINLSSRNADNSGIYTDFSPLSIQLRDGGITYSFDKNDGDTFDQKIFHSAAPSEHSSAVVEGTSHILSSGETVGPAEYVDQENIITKESTERSLGMYEPTLDVTKLVLAALEHARDNS